MWILPKNYQLSSPYAQDMVESKEDLTLPELNIESSLMWRSKPSPLRTWLPRWKRVSWMPHLCGRILKPCQWSHFETELTSSLAVIRANPLVPQESDLEKKTPDTSGLTSATSSGQLDLFDVSLKMSKDTLVSDSEKSLATWKALVTKLRGEYSQRVKLALLIRESESTSWPTPSANKITQSGHLLNQDGSDWDGKQKPHSAKTGKPVQTALTDAVLHHMNWPTVTTDSASSRTKKYAQGGMPLSMAVQTWPTPRVSSANGPSQNEIEMGNPKKRLETEVIVREPAQWPTPTVQDSDKATKKMRDNHQNNLTAVVFDQEMLPTPTTRDWKGGYKEDALTRKDGKSRRFDALPNAAIGGVGTDIVSGHLNPDWVEWLMGVPTGWTALDFWETE